MKKTLSLLCAVVIISATSLAQKAQNVTETKVVQKGDKIVFPPNCIAKVKVLGGEDLVSTLMNTNITILGQSKDGLVIQTENGQNMLLRRKRPPGIIILEQPYKALSALSTTPKKAVVYKLIGIDDDNNPIWACPNSKANWQINHTTGQAVDYVGHVTLLR